MPAPRNLQAASVQWLEYRRLTHEQVRALLVQGFLSIVNHVLPTVEATRSNP